LDEADIQNFLESFLCPKNIDVQSFLHNSAIPFEKRDISRTFLILNSESEILAYFSLSFKEVQLLSDELDKKSVKKLFSGFTPSNTDNRFRCFLIGQIGKNYSISNNLISLENILSDVYSVLRYAYDSVGGRVVILECEDHQSLVSLYESKGFLRLQTNQLVQMFKFIKFGNS
jgi:hypothetical protein